MDNLASVASQNNGEHKRTLLNISIKVTNNIEGISKMWCVVTEVIQWMT